MTDSDAHFDRVPPAVPAAHLVWEALVDVAPREDLGAGPAGHRFIVPITGGSFRGVAGYEGFRGTVLPGGADRQLVRPDGCKELDALYEMKLEDGGIITVRNSVVIDETREGPRYAMSRITLTVPQGPWQGLNKRLFIGTLQSARPEREAVIIRGWCVDSAPA
ncbi:DUF3237 domain-containing protein [Yangia mangrovi]|uniref:DUF3237 domain-containing protein n=1 Tax=Alloyangia mangrovi TaxID=1779329 RepID=A0A2A3JPZ9_9RHOB|nr:DUF3237 domain-containing protein [Alloyangia mangrovi]MCA0940089.1 DUF3237 domain-containing protein [Alloyangia pacifica]MCA0945744.1 DUF3237 domain-containing protein [Alloyangia pacifica]MCT4370483.1 DUF3237 domain-containing protein [Alloyangia mangrovi]